MSNPIYTALYQALATANPSELETLASETELHSVALLNGVNVLGELMILAGAAESEIADNDLIHLGAFLKTATTLIDTLSGVNNLATNQLRQGGKYE